MHDAEDLRNRPFLDRKAALARLLRGTEAVSRSTNTLPRTVPPYSSTPAGLAPRALSRSGWMAPIGLVRARSGSRSGIPPALRCSGSVATIGTDDLEAGALSFGLNV